jgi:hypothetical protein
VLRERASEGVGNHLPLMSLKDTRFPSSTLFDCLLVYHLFSGCVSFEGIKQAQDTRQYMTEHLETQIVLNLIRARNGMPFAQYGHTITPVRNIGQSRSPKAALPEIRLHLLFRGLERYLRTPTALRPGSARSRGRQVEPSNRLSGPTEPASVTNEITR